MASPQSSTGDTTPSLPIISITPYLLDDQSPSTLDRRAATSAAIHSACLNYGFFYLDISAFVDPREMAELASLARDFFALPQEEKDKISLKNEDHARGYARLKENVTNGKADNHEGLDFYRPVENPDKNRPLWGRNQWPDDPRFREKYENWVVKMQKLGLIVMEAMAIGLGMTPEEWKALRAQVDESFWVMRAIGYPPLPDDHDGFSCGAHKDYGCLTFLYADPTPNALQVFVQNSGIAIGKAADVSGLPMEQGTEEGHWITANPIPGCVVCNIGEMWEIWTDGLYKSTLHRVVHRGANYRVPFFFEPNFGALVKPLAAAKRIKEAENIVDKRTYEPVIYGDFLLSKVGNNFAGGQGKY
ncbi:Clavaminate synthase-like protein [Marasmius fiardii PR-910]|nr:Clavaminate synthase-like protein [Marasmius fiardii PR-910]